MAKEHLVIFICADDTNKSDPRKGEAEYMQAIAAELDKQGRREDTEYLAYKKLPDDESSIIKGNPRILPADDLQYAAMPHLDPGLVNRFYDRSLKSVSIVGVGNSTLGDVAGVLAEARRSCFPVCHNGGSGVKTAISASYVTHMVDDADALHKIVEKDIALFVKHTQSMMGIDSSLAPRVRLTKLISLPNTNALAVCQAHYDAYMKKGPIRAHEVVEGDTPFAFVVVNAGFPVGPEKQHFPYEETEARSHGRSLGLYLPTGTNLILAHGGPRNLVDEGRPYGQQTMAKLREAYEDAQMEKGYRPVVLLERYRPNLPYNAIKAGYIMARRENCIAFISNSEGYNTMDGADLHVDNRAKLLGMFPFGAQDRDPTGQRQENIRRYNRRGVAILGSYANGDLIVYRYQHEMRTPANVRDGAEHIVTALGLSKSSAPTAKLPLHPLTHP